MKRPDLDLIERNKFTNHAERRILIDYIKSKEQQSYDFNFKEATDLDEILENLNIGKTVKCCQCGKEHDSDGEDFFTFYGNLCIGLKGGLIGNHIHDMRIKRISVLCRTSQCMKYITKYIK